MPKVLKIFRSFYTSSVEKFYALGMCHTSVRTMCHGPFKHKSTYTVTHYSPSGNMLFAIPNKTKYTYNKNVPAPAAGKFADVQTNT